MMWKCENCCCVLNAEYSKKRKKGAKGFTILGENSVNFAFILLTP